MYLLIDLSESYRILLPLSNIMLFFENKYIRVKWVSYLVRRCVLYFRKGSITHSSVSDWKSYHGYLRASKSNCIRTTVMKLIINLVAVTCVTFWLRNFLILFSIMKLTVNFHIITLMNFRLWETEFIRKSQFCFHSKRSCLLMPTQSLWNKILCRISLLCLTRRHAITLVDDRHF